MIQPVALAVFGWTEIILIAALVVLLFGATKLPQIGRGLGEGIREFKNSLTGSGDDDKNAGGIASGDDDGSSGD